MKPSLRSTFFWLAPLALAAAPLGAQTVSFYGIIKTAQYYQSSAATPVLNSPTAYGFEAFVSGSNLSSLSPAPTFTSPASSGTAGGTLALNNGNFDYDGHFASKTAMDTAFLDGTYLMNVDGSSSLQIAFRSDFYPTDIPQLLSTTNGATWNGSNQLVVNTAVGDTLNFNNFSAYASGGKIEVDIDGSSVATSMKFTPSGANDAAITSYALAPGSLAPGTHEIDFVFDALSGTDNTSGPSGSYGVPVFGNDTSFTILAIPEPANDALGFALGALLVALIWRRRGDRRSASGAA